MRLVALLKGTFKNFFALYFLSDREQRLRRFLFLGLLIAFVISAEYLSFRYFKALQNIGDITLELISLILMVRSLGLLFLIIAAMLYFACLLSSIEFFYFDEDIDFLASSPLSRGQLVFYKGLLMYLHTVWLVFLVGIPVMAGYGRAVHSTYAHLIPMAFNLFWFTLPPACLAIVTVMILMRFLPIDRAKESVVALGLVISFILVSFYRYLSPSNLFQPQKLKESFFEFLREFTLPGGEFSLHNMLTQSLISSVSQKWDVYLENTQGLIGWGIVSFLIFYLAGRWLYQTDRPVSGAASRPGPLERFLGLGWGVKFFASRFRGKQKELVYRELIHHIRDPMQISHILLMLALVIFHFLNLREIPYIVHPLARILVAFLNMLLVGCMSAAVAVRFVYPGISLEGKSLWLIFTAPISHKEYLRIKFFANGLPLVLGAVSILFICNLMIEVPWELNLLWVSFMALVVYTIAKMGIAFSAAMPCFRFKNVFEISSSSGGIFFVLASLLYVLLSIMVIAGPTYAFVFDKQVIFQPLNVLLLVGFIGGSVALGYWFDRWGTEQFEAIIETL